MTQNSETEKFKLTKEHIQYRWRVKVLGLEGSLPLFLVAVMTPCLYISVVTNPMMVLARGATEIFGTVRATKGFCAAAEKEMY